MLLLMMMMMIKMMVTRETKSSIAPHSDFGNQLCKKVCPKTAFSLYRTRLLVTCWVCAMMIRETHFCESTLQVKDRFFIVQGNAVVCSDAEVSIEKASWVLFAVFEFACCMIPLGSFAFTFAHFLKSF